MADQRIMKLYRYDPNGTGRLFAIQEYEYLTQSQELQLAHNLANTYNVRDGEGHVTIYDNDGSVLKKLECPVK